MPPDPPSLFTLMRMQWPYQSKIVGAGPVFSMCQALNPIACIVFFFSHFVNRCYGMYGSSSSMPSCTCNSHHEVWPARLLQVITIKGWYVSGAVYCRKSLITYTWDQRVFIKLRWSETIRADNFYLMHIKMSMNVIVWEVWITDLLHCASYWRKQDMLNMLNRRLCYWCLDIQTI